MGKKKGKKYKSIQGMTSVIRSLVDDFDDSDTDTPEEKSAAAMDLLTNSTKKKIVRSALLKYYQAQELKPYQAELIKLQRHLENTSKKMIILFDGRDASGKGGTIRRVTRYMNEKHYRVIAPGKPSKEQQTELHIKRYIEHFPHAGEIVMFDRSWYNRAMVEPVMGFCTQDQYRRFLRKVVSYEANFMLDAGRTTLLKLYFSVSKSEQARRFERRRNDPLRQWKLSEVDLQAQSLWDEFTEKKRVLLEKTHTDEAPWFVIKSNDKHKARLETMKLILSSVKYRGRSKELDYTVDPNIVIRGDVELQNMKARKKKTGKYES